MFLYDTAKEFGANKHISECCEIDENRGEELKEEVSEMWLVRFGHI